MENTNIKYRKWEAKPPVGVMILVHGMGAGTARWESLAKYFLAKNISSYAISLRGFDGTPGEQGHIDKFDTYISDIRKLFDIARHEAPSVPVYLAGESMGALISFEIASKGIVPFDGYVIISPVFKSILRFPVLIYLSIFFSMIFFPKRQFKMPFNSLMCTSDTGESEKMRNDPGEHRYATGSLLREIFKRQVFAGRMAKKIRAKVFFLIAMDDQIADPGKSIEIFGRIPEKSGTLKKYNGMKHALTVEKDRDTVFRDIFKWCFENLGRAG